MVASYLYLIHLTSWRFACIYLEDPPQPSFSATSRLLYFQYKRKAYLHVDGLGLKACLKFQLKVHSRSPALFAWKRLIFIHWNQGIPRWVEASASFWRGCSCFYWSMSPFSWSIRTRTQSWPRLTLFELQRDELRNKIWRLQRRPLRCYSHCCSIWKHHSATSST